MGVIIFFGLSTFVVIVGLVYVILTLRHHWKEGKAHGPTERRKKASKESAQELS